MVITAIITQITFLPVLSTMKPRTGDAGAEMMYTILAKTEKGAKGELSLQDGNLKCNLIGLSGSSHLV